MYQAPTIDRLSIKVEGDRLIFFNPARKDDQVALTFHRTLRLPCDDKIYPLPPSLGTFPVRRVDDYLDKVPEKWKKQGGVFIPLFQREAMFIQFHNQHDTHPHAVKIAVGKVNALSGEIWDEELRKRTVQDYCVTPMQNWLDGINGGRNGTIKQFIAMPLGQGYTVEAQVTGEEKVGGCQIVAYSSKQDRRRIQFPEVKKNITIAKKYSGHVWSESNDCFDSLSNEPTYKSYSAPSQKVGSTCDNLFSSSYCSPTQQSYSGGVQSSYSTNHCFLLDDMFGSMNIATQNNRQKISQKPKTSSQELGLAAGGMMKQQIVTDPYSADFWDPNTKSRVFVHIVNSEMYKEITGENPPPSPISAKTYASYKYPWYDFYCEGLDSEETSSILSKVKNVKEMDQQMFAWSQQDDSTVNIKNVKIKKVNYTVRDGEW